MAGFLLVSSQQELSMPSSCHWVCAFGWAPGGLFTELKPLWRGRTHMASKSRCCGRLQGSPNTGSTMQWTIIRPGGLKSEPATGSGILTEDRSVCGAINREDVADLVVKALFSDKADGKVRQQATAMQESCHCDLCHTKVLTCL